MTSWLIDLYRNKLWEGSRLSSERAGIMTEVFLLCCAHLSSQANKNDQGRQGSLVKCQLCTRFGWIYLRWLFQRSIYRYELHCCKLFLLSIFIRNFMDQDYLVYIYSCAHIWGNNQESQELFWGSRIDEEAAAPTLSMFPAAFRNPCGSIIISVWLIFNPLYIAQDL